MLETIRGGMLLLCRWLIHYPIVHCTYRLQNWTRAPFRLQPELAEKPGILVSNYGNYFYDDMIGMMMGPVRPFVFVRDSLYRIWLLKPIFMYFRAIPIARASDPYFTPEQRRAFNDKTFAKVSGLLRKGHWFSVFPETSPGHRSKLHTPLRPGVAHVALMAEDAAGWNLGLNIYVYGTNYENKFAGRSYVHMRWASPIQVSKYRQVFQQNPAQAVETLMRDIEEALHSCVLEAPTIQELGDAHRLAFQQKQPTYPGVQQALAEVVERKASPEALRNIVCGRMRESFTYQLLGYILLGIGMVLGWPFRAFGKLCASEPSEEMTYQFMLWVLVLITGAIVGQGHWAKVQVLATWGAMSIWLWAWRRGIVA